MALDDFVEPEVGIAVAATALALSPKVRGTVRQWLVYGLAGVLKAGDAVSGAARGVATSAQQVGGATVGDVVTEAKQRSGKTAGSGGETAAQ